MNFISIVNIGLEKDSPNKATPYNMSFWKKWWKKKNKDKKGAEEYEDAPLPTETIFADNDLEKRIRARRNNLSVSRSGRYKAKSKERSQLSDNLFNKADTDEPDYNKNHTEAGDGHSHCEAGNGQTYPLSQQNKQQDVH